MSSVVLESLYRRLYAVDASVYRELPEKVVIAKSESEIIDVIQYANAQKSSIIPRGGGTSLAGQCVGSGIVIDVSKYLNKVLEFDEVNGIVKVQPGIVRDELNQYLRKYGWFFGPNTSTSDRCTIGGMVANNSSGSTSIKYGTTRDKVLALKAIMSDGSTVTFEERTTGFNKYERSLISLLNQKEVQDSIRNGFPKASIKRRNTGYALDTLIQQKPFSPEGSSFNAAKLLCGSEGTLAFITEITIQLDPLPPPAVALMVPHFKDLKTSLVATRRIMQLAPYACELIDKTILECSKTNMSQSDNRFFIEGEPAAILAVEIRAKSDMELLSLIKDTQKQAFETGAYSCPVLRNKDIAKLWELRSAGLGLLANIPGVKKAVACIEDTAVDLHDLPEYIEEFQKIMSRYKQKAVYYAHAGAGELHLRPILDLRSPKDLKDFRYISEDVARLVKRFNGSLSGEHGDGRVRSEFIPFMVGPKNYDLFKTIKRIFDPTNLFNPNKIVYPPKMDSNLRASPEKPLSKIESYFDYSNEGGFMAAVEKCNGSGDCRKQFSSGGAMCPSFQATRDEKDSTRGRANALREFISTTVEGQNHFNHPELKEVLDLCISCKACARECPSNVDMAAMKAEWQYQYYRFHKIPFRSKVLGNLELFSPLASKLGSLLNPILSIPAIENPIKGLLGISKYRSLPRFSKSSVHNWYLKNKDKYSPKGSCSKIYLFLDEFTDYQDFKIGVSAIKLLWRLGYDVIWQKHAGSARAMISKGLLENARSQIDANIKKFHPLCSLVVPLIGIEPSAILGFKDEYPRLCSKNLRVKAKELAKCSFTIDEFLANEIRKGILNAEDFNAREFDTVILHGHCHQKALTGLGASKEILKTAGYKVEIVPGGCCGMAGSFGYEKEHYDMSINMANLHLFPYLESYANKPHIVVATGTSCRQQIKDGMAIESYHWVEVV